MRDEALRRSVEDELDREPSVDASDIGVAAKDGVVSLTGFVPSYTEKRRAARVALRVPCVKAVANDIELRLPGALVRTDADIARAAFEALKERTSIPDERIKVSVTNGWVYLDGEVDRAYQKRAALEAVQSLVGVKGVVNQLSVRAKVAASELESRIEAALGRSALLDGHQVRVESHDGKVTLLGQMHSWSERQEVERMAWSAPGVSEVENLIMITP